MNTGSEGMPFGPGNTEGDCPLCGVDVDSLPLHLRKECEHPVASPNEGATERAP